MGNIFCQRSSIMDSKNFDEKTTIKVSGVSRFLKDQLTKAFQSDKNSVGVSGDVARLYVCPDAQDHVLVEFGSNVKDIQLRTHKEVDINGTKLGVEPYVHSTASAADKPTYVTIIWEIDEDKQQSGLLPERKTPLLEGPFCETRVKLKDDFLEKIKEKKEAKDMLAKGDIKLEEGGYLIGKWTAIYEAGQSLVRWFYGADENGGRASSDLPVIRVQTLLLRYIMTYHHRVFQRLENVCQEVHFKVLSDNEKMLELYSRLDVEKAVFVDALDKFIAFYQKQYEKMIQETKSVRSEINADVISEACSKFSVIIEFSEDSKILTIYGEKAKVHETLRLLTTKCDIDNVASKTGTARDVSREMLSEQFSYDLSDKIKLIVYQGDLVKENVDVIVNPANERLEHCGGAAEAILKAGGKIIQVQSNDIMRKRRKCLVAGEVETTAAGKLPCKFIVHAVGPRRSEHDRNSATHCLYNAVLNSLIVACNQHAQSISIPAISSGVFGIPVDFCADVLFNAVEAFAKDKRTAHYQLREIRFVNIDRSTTEQFVKEMMKRYSSNVKRESRAASSTSAIVERSNGTASDAERQLGAMNANSLTSNAGLGSNDLKGTTDLKGSSDEECSICLSKFTNKRTLDKCGHSFCSSCIDEAFKHQKKCPICSQVYGPLIGNQPPGKMIVSYASMSLPGFRSCGSITVTYKFEDGVQGQNHPNPGKRYQGTTRCGYLPDNKEGRKVVKLLQKAFEQKLTFTIGRSTTLGVNNVITWNDIHHKTRRTGGPTNFGYPDPDYLKRVQEELAAKGITE